MHWAEHEICHLQVALAVSEISVVYAIDGPEHVALDIRFKTEPFARARFMISIAPAVWYAMSRHGRQPSAEQNGWLAVLNDPAVYSDEDYENAVEASTRMTADEITGAVRQTETILSDFWAAQAEPQVVCAWLETCLSECGPGEVAEFAPARPLV